jgi:hypothetical protein
VLDFLEVRASSFAHSEIPLALRKLAECYGATYSFSPLSVRFCTSAAFLIMLLIFLIFLFLVIHLPIFSFSVHCS